MVARSIRKTGDRITAMPESCDSYWAMTGRGTSRILIVAIIAAGLGGCTSDDTTGRFLVEPDKYVLYTCAEMAAQMQGNADRQRQLEELTARANTTSSGQIMSTVAYRPEYLQLRGEMNELRRTSADKKCKPVTIVVPGARVSDEVVR